MLPPGDDLSPLAWQQASEEGSDRPQTDVATASSPRPRQGPSLLDLFCSEAAGACESAATTVTELRQPRYSPLSCSEDGSWAAVPTIGGGHGFALPRLNPPLSVLYNSNDGPGRHSEGEGGGFEGSVLQSQDWNRTRQPTHHAGGLLRSRFVCLHLRFIMILLYFNSMQIPPI